MPTSCSAINCTNRFRRGNGISFHQFPYGNPELLQKWIIAVNREDFVPRKSHSICSKHFEEDCFLRNYCNLRKLRSDAVPTKFDFPSHQKKLSNMTGCSAFGCTNRGEKGFLMKRFPRDPVRNALWTAKINRQNWTPSFHSRLCEVHFEPDQWEKTRTDGQRKLKQNAIPTIFYQPIKKPIGKKILRTRFSQPKRSKQKVECEEKLARSCSPNYDHDINQSNDLGKTLKAIKYDGTTLDVLDQLLLPHRTRYENVLNVNEGWEVIRSMKVTGAQAISIVGALSLAVELKSSSVSTKSELHNQIQQKLEHLMTARSTAINLKQVVNSTVSHSLSLLQDEEVSVCEMKNRVVEEIEELMKKDISVNESIGLQGGMHILSSAEELVTILTHCNTGNLATAGYGTALGVIRWLHQQKRLSHVYFTETRPSYLGARLTSYELAFDQIPATLIGDNMVSALLNTTKITAVVVGADRIAANSDIVNEIGTYNIAISALYHGVPFYVAAPTSAFDINLENGSVIPMEERPDSDMTMSNLQSIIADGINYWNPASDVTPSELITGGVITEYGVFPACSLKKLKDSFQAL